MSVSSSVICYKSTYLSICTLQYLFFIYLLYLPICNLFTHMTRVYERYPELLAEMYAYSMAAAHEQLPHFTLYSLMVSDTESEHEGKLTNEIC